MFTCTTQEKLNWLREQIEMRVIGLSWTDWKTPWGSSHDEEIGTVRQLRDHLSEVLAAEAEQAERGWLPSKTRALSSADGVKSECPAPQLRRKTFKALGTPTVQSDALCSDRTSVSPAELVAHAERRRAELEALGEIDWVCDRQPFATGQVIRCVLYCIDRKYNSTQYSTVLAHTRLCVCRDQPPTKHSSERRLKFAGATVIWKRASRSTFGSKEK